MTEEELEEGYKAADEAQIVLLENNLKLSMFGKLELTEEESLIWDQIHQRLLE